MQRRTFIKHTRSAIFMIPTAIVTSCKMFKGSALGKLNDSDSPSISNLTQDLIFNQRISEFDDLKVSPDFVALLGESLASGRPIRALGGGHGYLGQALCDNGLIADMRGYRKVTVDSERNTVTVQAGARFVEIYRALSNSQGELSLVLPTGDCPTVGVAGYTLGGGYGHLSRWFGLMCDNVIEMKVLLINDAQQIVLKELSRSSTGEDAELFWALRGSGGGNFGIVTEFTFQAYSKPLGLKIYNLHLRGDLNREEMAAALSTYFSWLSPLIKDSSISSKLAFGRGFFHIEGLYTDVEKIRPLFQALQAWTNNLRSDIELDFNLSEIIRAFKMCSSLEECEAQPKQAFAARSAFLSMAQVWQAIPKLCEQIELRSSTYSSYGGVEIMAWHMRGGVSSDNAFVHRDHDFLCQFYTHGMTDEREEWMQDTFTAVTGLVDNSAETPGYQNYTDGSIKGADRGFPEAYFPQQSRLGLQNPRERLEQLRLKFRRLG